MREMSASEASRNFSLSNVVRRRHDRAELDETFAANVAAARSAVAASLDTDPWRD